MKLRFLLFISALIGAIFSFWYLVYRPLQSNELTNIEQYAKPINHVLFFISLFFMLLTFFIKKKTMHFIGKLLIVVGLLYLTLMFSFIETSYYFIIPLILYMLTGFLMLGYKKKYD